MEQEADPEADTDKEKIDRLSLGSRASLREDVTSRMKTPLEMNRVLTALLEDDRQTSPIGIEEVRYFLDFHWSQLNTKLKSCH